MPYFFGTMLMTAPRRPGPGSRQWTLFIGFLSVCVVTVLIALIYLVSNLPEAVSEDVTAGNSRSAFTLPTAAPPPITPGPPAPQKVKFAPAEPIKGFPNCDSYGFKGVVSDRNGKRLQGVQIVAWEDKVGLLNLTNTDTGGSYLIEVEAEPGLHKVWVQVFENDIPVSEAVAVETQINCETGFQIYQVNWQEISD
jgi:hypothetical protein